MARTLTAGRPAAAAADLHDRFSVVGYLRTAATILRTTAKARDVYAPELGEVVPMSVRSDGEWVWSDAHAYYAERYGLVTDEDFLAHIRERGYQCRQIGVHETGQVLEAFYSVSG